MLSEEALLVRSLRLVGDGRVKNDAEKTPQDQLSVLLFLIACEIFSHLHHVEDKKRCVDRGRYQPDFVEYYEDKVASVHGNYDRENCGHILLSVLKESEVVKCKCSDGWTYEPRGDR